jgi:DNA primase small subunit
LIRLTNSLHGKTALKKVKISISDLENFDPLQKAVAFKEGEVRVYVSDAPKFRMGDKMYGPFKEKKIDLPTAAALILVCKGIAKVVK